MTDFDCTDFALAGALALLPLVALLGASMATARFASPQVVRAGGRRA